MQFVRVQGNLYPWFLSPYATSLIRDSTLPWLILSCVNNSLYVWNLSPICSTGAAIVNTPFILSSVNAAGVAISTSVNCTFVFSRNCFNTLQFGQFFVEYIMTPCTLISPFNQPINFIVYNGFLNYVWILIVAVCYHILYPIWLFSNHICYHVIYQIR